MATSYWIAGSDKPHRCPSCWGACMHRRPWKLRRWLPRRCPRCAALTLTTFPSALLGVRIGGGNDAQ